MNTIWALSVVVPLLDPVPDPEDVKPGWLGFAMFVALAVATVLLWLSFRRQLKKVNFEEEPDPTPRSPGATPGSTPGSIPGSTPDAPPGTPGVTPEGGSPRETREH